MCQGFFNHIVSFDVWHFTFSFLRMPSNVYNHIFDWISHICINQREYIQVLSIKTGPNIFHIQSKQIKQILWNLHEMLLTYECRYTANLVELLWKLLIKQSFKVKSRFWQIMPFGRIFVLSVCLKMIFFETSL